MNHVIGPYTKMRHVTSVTNFWSTNRLSGYTYRNYLIQTIGVLLVCTEYFIRKDMFHIFVITFKESIGETYFHLSSVTCTARYSTETLLVTRRQAPDMTLMNSQLPGTLVLIRVLESCTVFLLLLIISLKIHTKYIMVLLLLGI